MDGRGGRRVAAIGLDSAEWSLLEPMMAEGRLPHLSSLRQRAAQARLEHADYRTGLVWEHFVTGRGAAGNDRWSVLRFDPATYEVVKEGARPRAPFFASVPGRTVAFDLPYVTLASAGEDTVAVTAWGGHDPAYLRASSPPGLLREIEQRFGPHPAFDNDYEIIWNRPADIDALCDALVAGAERRTDVSGWLLERFDDWRLFVTVMSEPHSASEQLWHGIDDDYPVNAVADGPAAGRRLRQVYEGVDRALGRLLGILPDDVTLVVFSMHGAGANDADVASMVLLPELLHRLAFGQPFLRDPDQQRWLADGRRPVRPDPSVKWHDFMTQYLPVPAPRRGPRDLVRSVLPEPVLAYWRGRRARRARRAEPEPAPSPARLGVLGIPITEEVDAGPDEIGIPCDPLEWQIATKFRSAWPEMPAFALPTFYDGRVRINLVGRERRGVVSAGDYDKACRNVEEAVRQCRDARTGAPVVAEVIRLRDDDPLAPDGPDADLQIVWSHPFEAMSHPDAGIIGPYPFRRTGGHRSGGFALVAGPDIAPGDLGTHDALAVPATVAELAGGDLNGLEALPLPLDGRG